MTNNVPPYLLVNDQFTDQTGDVGRIRISFLERTVLSSARTVRSIYLQAENSVRENIFRKINPGVKLLSLIYMAVVISLVNNIGSQLLISAFIFMLYCFAGVKILRVYRKIFLISFFLGFLVVLPASLNIITPGNIVFNLITLEKPYHFWIYSIPQNIGFTSNGFQVVALFFLRVLNSVSFAFLIVYTTQFPAFVKSFRILGIPDTFLMVLTLAYKYIFILSRTIEETFLALKSRLAGNINNSNARQLVGGRIFFIFKRSVNIYENTYNAMVSRGYDGKIRIYSQHKFTFTDIIALLVVAASGVIILLL